MRAQPGVDAGEMESVAALGEQAEALRLQELAEADGANRAMDLAVAPPVLVDRDLADQGLVESVGPGRLAASVIGGEASLVVAAEPEAVVGSESAVAEKEEGAGKDANGGDEDGGGSGGGGGERGRRRRSEDVAPLRAVDAAEARGAVPVGKVGNPRLGSIGRRHGRELEGRNWLGSERERIEGQN